MIGNLETEEFAEVLNSHLSPAAPIQSEEHLFGRDAQVRDIGAALYAHGRTIFIYGDRGVGKTSLAQTVAFKHQASRHNPVIVACSSNSTFAGLLDSVLQALESDSQKEPSTTKAKLGVGLPHGGPSANLE